MGIVIDAKDSCYCYIASKSAILPYANATYPD